MSEQRRGGNAVSHLWHRHVCRYAYVHTYEGIHAMITNTNTHIPYIHTYIYHVCTYIHTYMMIHDSRFTYIHTYIYHVHTYVHAFTNAPTYART